MSLSRQLTHDRHTRRFVVAFAESGWEVREEQDTEVLRRVRRTDWHRVERDIQLFDVRAQALKRNGWVEDGQGS